MWMTRGRDLYGIAVRSRVGGLGVATDCEADEGNGAQGEGWESHSEALDGVLTRELEE
jgi:hypothetical protein